MKDDSHPIDRSGDDAEADATRADAGASADAKSTDAKSAGARSGGKAPIVVKKYANRRLYNTATSSYVTLENLAAMVREGQDFVVQDARSGEDITRSVLTQVIFEEEARGRAPMLPTSFLRQIIRLYGDTLQSYVPSYLEMAMGAFEQNQETFRQQMARSFGATPGFAQFEAMTRANADIFRKALEMFSSFANTPTGAEAAGAPRGEREKLDAAGAAAGDEASGEELEQMRRQLAEMQKKVDALTKKG